MPELIIFRPQSEKDAGQVITLLVDGREVGRCRNGCGIRAELQEGDHIVEAVMGEKWRSPPLSVKLSSEQPCELECGVRFNDEPIRFRPCGGKGGALIIGAVILAQYGYRVARNYAYRDQYLWLRHRC